MNKLIAVLVAGMFGLGSVSVFAAEAATQDAPKAEQKSAAKGDMGKTAADTRADKAKAKADAKAAKAKAKADAKPAKARAAADAAAEKAKGAPDTR